MFFPLFTVSMALSSSFTSHPKDLHDFICPLSQVSALLSLPSSCASLIPWCPLRLLWWCPWGSFPFSNLPSNPIYSKGNTGKGPSSKSCLGCGVSEIRRVELLKKGFVEFWRQLEHQLPWACSFWAHTLIYTGIFLSLSVLLLCFMIPVFISPHTQKPFIFLINSLTDLLLYLPDNFIPDVFAF